MHQHVQRILSQNFYFWCEVSEENQTLTLLCLLQLMVFASVYISMSQILCLYSIWVKSSDFRCSILQSMLFKSCDMLHQLMLFLADVLFWVPFPYKVMVLYICTECIKIGRVSVLFVAMVIISMEISTDVWKRKIARRWLSAPVWTHMLKHTW